MATDDLLTRLQALRTRLAATRPAVEARAPWPMAERFDHAPEAAWGPPEVLAHVAEMLPYWQGEVERILAGQPGPVPFGRIGTDPVRVAIIERDRSLPVGELYERIETGFDRWSRRLPTLTPDDWSALGAHPIRGDLSITAILERLILAHTEEHAEQLEGLLGTGASGPT